jgi:hypothetical protein
MSNGRWARWHSTRLQRLVLNPLWHCAGEWAPDALVLLHQTLIVSVYCVWRQLLRKPQLRQTLGASAATPSDASGDRISPPCAYWTVSVTASDVVRQRPSQATSAALQPQRRQRLGASGAPPTDASDGCSTVRDSYWTAFGERRTRGLHSIRHIWWRENDRWKFDCTGHVAASWMSDTVCRVCCLAIDASVDPVFLNNGSIRRGTSIYMCWPALGLFSWHFDILVSILSWANALTPLLTHLLAFDCDF